MLSDKNRVKIVRDTCGHCGREQRHCAAVTYACTPQSPTGDLTLANAIEVYDVFQRHSPIT